MSGDVFLEVCRDMSSDKIISTDCGLILVKGFDVVYILKE